MANPYNNEGITLKIKLTPQIMERLVWALIILVLAFFVIFGTFCDKCQSNNTPEQKESAVTGAAVTGANEKNTITDSGLQDLVEETETVGEANESAEEQSEETAETAANNTIQLNETIEANETVEEVTYSGNIDLTINDVITELKNEGKYGKVTGVRFTINNEKKDFMPLVEVYTYVDGETGTVFVSQPRVERIYSDLKLGESNSYELEISSQQFTDLNSYVVCKVVIKDKSSEEILTTATERTKIS
jgi:hypothetical protein